MSRLATNSPTQVGVDDDIPCFLMEDPADAMLIELRPTAAVIARGDNYEVVSLGRIALALPIQMAPSHAGGIPTTLPSQTETDDRPETTVSKNQNTYLPSNTRASQGSKVTSNDSGVMQVSPQALGLGSALVESKQNPLVRRRIEKFPTRELPIRLEKSRAQARLKVQAQQNGNVINTDDHLVEKFVGSFFPILQ